MGKSFNITLLNYDSGSLFDIKSIVQKSYASQSAKVLVIQCYSPMLNFLQSNLRQLSVVTDTSKP